MLFVRVSLIQILFSAYKKLKQHTFEKTHWMWVILSLSELIYLIPSIIEEVGNDTFERNLVTFSKSNPFLLTQTKIQAPQVLRVKQFKNWILHNRAIQTTVFSYRRQNPVSWVVHHFLDPIIFFNGQLFLINYFNCMLDAVSGGD